MTDSESQDDAPGRARVVGHWTFDPALPQVHVDEAVLVSVNDRVFLTFGQIVVSLPVAAAARPSESPAQDTTVEIRPVARLVLTEAGFHRLVAMLNKIADNIPNPGADKAHKRED
jgi:hypothetical protein